MTLVEDLFDALEVFDDYLQVLSVDVDHNLDSMANLLICQIFLCLKEVDLDLSHQCLPLLQLVDSVELFNQQIVVVEVVQDHGAPVALLGRLGFAS